MSGVEAVVGVAAAGVGFASLAIQLLDSIQKLKAFHGKIKNAPSALEDLIFDLETIGRQLDLLERHKSCDTSEAELLARCVSRCHMRTDRIQALVSKMQRIGDNNARLGRFYLAFKDPDVAKLVAELEQAKSSLNSSMLTFYFDRQSKFLQEQAATTKHHNMQLALISTHMQANTSALTSLADRAIDQCSVSTVLHSHSPHLRRQSECLQDTDVVSRQVKRAPKRGERNRTWQFTIRFPRLICSQIWNLSAVRAEFGWDLKLRTSTARDPDSEVFYRCLTGDVRAVQRMIAEGEASPRDHSPVFVRLGPRLYVSQADERVEHNLFWKVAAYSGQVELVQWLLGAFGDNHVISLRGLLYLLRMETPRPTMMNRILRGLLESGSTNFDMDFTTPGSCESLQWMEEHQINTLLDGDVFSNGQQSALDFFEAMSSRSIFTTARTFLRVVGLKSTSSELATLITRNGRLSILHFVAKMLAWAPDEMAITDSAIEDWLAIASTLLKHGFKPSAKTYSDCTALWCLVDECPNTPCGSRWASEVIRAWVRTVQEAGIDLPEYGRHEADIWRLKYLRQSKHLESEVIEMSLSYGHTADQWSVTKSLSTSKSVSLYEMERMPGIFGSNPYIPTYICWDPDDFDQGAHSWRFVSIAKSWRQSRDAFQENEEHETKKKNTCLPADDAALTVTLASRGTKWVVTPRRSASLPPTIHGQDDMIARLAHSFTTPAWYSRPHYCVSTASCKYANIHKSGARACANDACRRADHLDRHPVFAWQGANFLADIRDCQDGYIPSNSRFYGFRRSLSLHTGTRDCPQGCAKVHLEKFHVPQAFREFHPLRYTSERWDDP